MIRRYSSKFANGDLLKDVVTGLEGIVMVVAFYSTGCIHYGLQPRKMTEKNDTPDWSWLDESRLELIEACAVNFNIDFNAETSKRPSGPQPSGPEL